MIVVSDSGPLIALSKLSLLSLLHELFAEIVIPMEVWREVVERGKGKPGSDVVEKAGWVNVKEVNDLSVDILSKEIERGEAEAIILAKELNADLLLLDEKIPREIAKSLGLKVTGTIGLIYIALKQGIADGDLEELVLELKRSGVWISEEIIEEVRRLKSLL
jgi:predicted nucleic acid-binding protein